MANSRPKVVVLAGPTGSGKSGAALSLVRHLREKGRQAVVINADSRQLYADFPLITAQPGTEEQACCPHLLYGYLATNEPSSAWQWAERAKICILQVIDEEKIPLLVGGTGLYLRALLDGMADIPKADHAVSARLQQECEAFGLSPLHEKLARVDPDYAGRIHPHDRQRIIRALEVWESTGNPLSWWHGHNRPAPEWDLLRLGIGLPLPELEPLLYQRIALMLEAGALDEARQALTTCPDTSAPGWSGIGCAEIAAYLRGDSNLDECKRLWGKNTRAYAKRQWTWFRADSRILWFRPEDTEGLQKTLNNFLGLG